MIMHLISNVQYDVIIMNYIDGNLAEESSVLESREWRALCQVISAAY